MSCPQNDCGCKIGRITTKHTVSDVESRLGEEWQTDTSVRRLTEDLNSTIIEDELNNANVGNVEWSRTPVYKALHTDDLSDADEIEIRRELERAGIDVEQLAADWVSHQKVYRHLTQCLDASKDDEQTPAERREQARNTVHALQQRIELVTRSTLETLQAAGITKLGTIEMLVDIQVVCGEYGQSMDLETAISNGCHCETT